jgi:outer membrane biosynthesis protein TonB
VPAPDFRSALAQPIPTLALGLSIVLHVAVFYAASRVPWFVADAPEASVASRVVWLNSLPRIAPSETPPPPEPASPPEPPPDPEPPPAPEPPQSGAVSPPAAETEPEPPQPDSPLRADAPENVSPAPPTEGNRRQRSYLVPGIDWDEERERAVTKALEQQAREENYRTFSSGDVFEEPQAETPNPREHLFDNPSGGRGRERSVLRTGQSRSRFLNRLAEICNALTSGGIGLGFNGLRLGTACTEPGPTADFFADLRPDYMNMLPVCTENEIAQGQVARFDAAGNEIPTIKCRLVEKDEIDGLPAVPSGPVIDDP